MRVIAILSFLVSLFVSFHVMLVFTGNTYFYNVLKLTIFKGRLGPSLTDYKKFPNDTLKTNIPKYWKEGEIKQAPEFLIEANKDFKTTAFLVIKNNEIVYENYAEGFSENIPSNSFSMAKSFVSALVGVAIQQQKMAEANLLPAVRNAEMETFIVADGTSCRHQIKDGADRETLHVARLLEISLNS